jgi:hypothetical protein
VRKERKKERGGWEVSIESLGGYRINRQMVRVYSTVERPAAMHGLLRHWTRYTQSPWPIRESTLHAVHSVYCPTNVPCGRYPI